MEELQRKKQSYKKIGIKFRETANVCEERLKKGQAQMEERDKKIEDLESELERKNREMEEKHKSLDFDRRTKQKSDETETRKRGEMEKKEKEIQQLRSKILELEKELKRKDGKIEEEKSRSDESRKEIIDLKLKVELLKDVEKQLLQSESFVKDLNAKIRQLENENELKLENISELKDDLATRDSILKMVQSCNLVLDSSLTKSSEEMNKKEKEYFQKLSMYKESMAAMKQKVTKEI